MVDMAAMSDSEIVPGRGAAQSHLSTEEVEFLLGHAILAPSSHNTQPWIFEVHDHGLEVHADLTRWLRVADADRRELHVSLGCAIENLVLAAEHLGLAPVVHLFPDDEREEHVATLRLPRRSPGARPSRPAELLEAVLGRHTERGMFDATQVPEPVRAELRGLVVEEGVRVHLLDRPELRRRIEELTVRADEIQFADPAWRRELAHWIGEGVFGTSWLLSKVGGAVVRHLDMGRSVGKKDRERLASAPLLGFVSTTSAEPVDRVRAGQAFERVFLAATRSGLALHPMNQVLQVPEVRGELIELLPRTWGTPQMMFRLGHVEVDDDRTPSPRRPLADVVRWRRSRRPA